MQTNKQQGMYTNKHTTIPNCSCTSWVMTVCLWDVYTELCYKTNRLQRQAEWVKYCGRMRKLAKVDDTVAELYCNYVLPFEQKSMPYKRKVPSLIYSRQSCVNNGQIMNVTSLKKPSLKKRGSNEGRQCTCMAGSVSQRSRKKSDRLNPFLHTWSILSGLWVIQLPFPLKPTTIFTFVIFLSTTWLQTCVS